MVEFNLISLDVSLLGLYSNAKSGIGTSSFFPSSATASSRGAAVVTPWAVENTNSLLNRYNKIRSKSNFINENTAAVRAAGFDKDDKALFTLYSALTDLRTIAQYAADKGTATTSIASLSAQLSGGILQINDYIRSAELDKLLLMSGEKKSFMISDASLGKNDRDIVGGRIAAISETSPILNLNGDEVFTINIEASSILQNDITIDLSQISGEITLTSLKNYINSKIGEITTVNSNGDTVGAYKTRVKINEISEGHFGFTFDVDGIEKLTFSAATSDPALIIAGTTKLNEFGAIETGTLTKYTDLNGSGLSTSYSQEIAGVDEFGFVFPEKDADGNVIDPSKQVFETTPQATAVDAQGNVYVVGTTQGDIDGQINDAKTQDVFLSKFSSTGVLLWSRLIGASDEAEAFALAIDSQDNVIIGGKVNEELIASDVFSGTDSFVAKFSNSGQVLFVRQLDTISTDQVNDLTIDANDDIYFTGQVTGQFDVTTTDNGGVDATIVKIDGSSGIVTQTSQFGSAADDIGAQIAIASDGHILVAAVEDGRAVVRKLDKNNFENTLATYDIGDLNGGTITGISVEGSDIYITGSSQNGSLNGGTVSTAYSGGSDGFVAKLNDGGSSLAADWITYIGTTASDEISGLTVQNGAVYVAGTTGGVLSGETGTGITDGFSAKIDATTGATLWQEQLQGAVAGYNQSTAIAYSTNGSSVLDKLGLASGTIDNSEVRNIETQTSARVGDHFYISINEGRKIKIAIRADDTFQTLADRIDNLSLKSIKATVTLGVDGPQLKIEATRGAHIEFSAGKEGSDALHKLGLEERSILAAGLLFDLGGSGQIDPNDLGGVFALGLNSGFSFSDKTQAEYIFTKLDHAINVIQSAHRSLTFDPIRAQLLQNSKNNIGPAPAHLQAQLERYQDGLRRVLAVTGGTFI